MTIPASDRIPLTDKTCPRVFVVLEKIHCDKPGLACVAHRCFKFGQDQGSVNIYRTALESAGKGNRVENVSFADLLARFDIINSNGLSSPAGTIPRRKAHRSHT